MKFIPNYQPYKSIRYPIYANNGMVCTSSPQAAAAGLDVLKNGGNAIDAAIATASALTVTEPSANGIGSDCFALVWIEKEKKLYGLNASGYSPKNISIEKVKARIDNDKMPTYGWIPTMVPGAPAGWAALSERFGKVSLLDSLTPAINYAQNGYPVGANLAKMWDRAYHRYKKEFTTPEFDNWFKTFTPNDVIPKAGDIVKLTDHAKTLRLIGETNAKAFYEGELMEKIVSDSEKNGGYFCKEDFSEYKVDWVEPISVNYRGYNICEIPPNGQGIVALMALNILKEFDFKEKECIDTYHKQWEAMKIAFADGKEHVTDPKHMKVNYNDLLNSAYGKKRSEEITEQAQIFGPDTPPKSGTVYLCTADSEGNMVSFIQSNYMGFGSGIVVEGTGISLQNRGADFSLDENHSNALMPLKKTYHTIIPGFITKDNKAIGPFGVMGGYMQPQGHVQVAMNLIDFNLNPQQALDAPRWQWMNEKKFIVEDNFSNEIAKQLAAKGHTVEIALDSVSFGRGQIIIKQDNGVLIGGTEGRTDSNIACY